MSASFTKAIVVFSIVSTFLLGCAGAPLNVKPIAKTEHPAALLDKLGKDLAAAKANRVNLLSPNWFAAAQASFANAKTGLDKGSELSGILENIATGQAQLAQSLIYADKSSKYLSDVIRSRDAGLKAGADRYQKAFADLEKDFLRLTEAIEDGDSAYVRKKKNSANNRYRELELRAIKDDSLAEVRRLISTGLSLDMDESAPKSYLIAKSKLVDADAVITKNRYDRKAIDEAVQEARFYGQRWHQLAAASDKLKEMAPEDIALWMESFLAQTNATLKESDRRNLPFNAQQEVILSAIATLQRNQSSVLSQVQAKNLEIREQSKRISDLEGRSYQERIDKERLATERERLAAEKRFNELYNQVQGYFSAEHAEVYKKARHLIIRLKAMQFPVGQASIIPSNYPLLTTVQKAIHAFGQPDVVIEGHTDSTGSESLNQKLSRQRAESVRQYLIHNGVLPAGKITARGYGSSRPLASNATAQGRAINRRIDVVVKPVQ